MSLVKKSETDFFIPVNRIIQRREWECWYVAALMVRSYRHLDLVLSTNIDAICRVITNQGLTVPTLTKFAKEAGLRTEPAPSQASAVWYSQTLKHIGPIWVAVRRPNARASHSFVIHGVQDKDLVVAEPDAAFPAPLLMSIAEFQSIARPNIPILHN